MEKSSKDDAVSEPLLGLVEESGESDENFRCSGSVIGEEIKKQLIIAMPMIVMNLLQTSVQLVSVMFVGHLSELALSSASVATSFANVTGFSFMIGMASGLETLCGQAYGARQYRMLGIHMQRAMFTLFCICVPLSIVWIYIPQILLALGQDPSISVEAGDYARWLIPSLFSYAFLSPLTKFLQTQSIIMPMMFSSAIVLIVHVPLCWALVFKAGLESKGAALASAASNWLNVALLALYIIFSPTCRETRAPISTEAFHDTNSFLRLAVPSAVMMCLEWWSFEILTLLSGLLPNPELQTSVLSMCLNTSTFAYMIPYGLGAAASTRVSNELGAGSVKAALLAVRVALSVAITESIIRGSILFSLRKIIGRVYSNEEEVIQYMVVMMPLLAASTIMDGLQAVLCGIARGCGQQKWGAIANLGAYYIVGIPLAATLSFVLHLGAKGLWLGILGGLLTQTVLLLLVTICTDWNKQAKKARERTCDSLLPMGSDISKVCGVGDNGGTRFNH